MRAWYKGSALAFQAKEDRFESDRPHQIPLISFALERASRAGQRMARRKGKEG